jgi:hypothetical protein
MASCESHQPTRSRKIEKTLDEQPVGIILIRRVMASTYLPSPKSL